MKGSKGERKRTTIYLSLDSGPYGMVEKEIHTGTYSVDSNALSIILNPTLESHWYHCYNSKKTIDDETEFKIIPGSALNPPNEERSNEISEFFEIGGIKISEYLPTKISSRYWALTDITHLVDWVNKKNPGQFAVPNGELMWLITKEISSLRSFGW